MEESEKPTFKSLLPTGVLFGLGLGNFFGASATMMGISGVDLPGAILSLIGFLLLVIFQYGLMAVWRPRPHWAVFIVSLVGWLASAPWAAVQSRFGLIAWLLWSVVLLFAWGIASLVHTVVRRVGR